MCISCACFSSDPTTTGTYDSADILISGTGSGQTWSVLYPTTTPTATTTTLSASPSGSAGFSASVTLTADVSSATAGETVQFQYVTSTNAVHALGTATTNSSGQAVFSTSSIPRGTFTLLATFAGNTAFSGSTGTVSGYQVVPATTTTVLGALPASPTNAGTPVTLTATVTSGANAVAEGQVQFLDGSTALGAPVPLTSGGTAVSGSLTTLPVGTDALSAVFTDAAGNYLTSTGPLSYTVNGTPTTTTLTGAPTSPQAFGTSVTLTATVTSGVAGTVQFEVGSTDLGSPVAVSGGVATFTTSSLPGGSDSLSAAFTPTTAGFSASTGTAIYVIDPLATTTALTVSPASPQVSGTAETLRAAIIPAGATGTVQFEVGSTDLGSPVTVRGGVATFPTSALPPGLDSLSAVFAPANGDYTGSTGTVSFDVITPTTTSLTVSPASPQHFGLAVTLTATVTAGVPGAVQFEVGSTDLGSPVAVSGGVATLTTSSLPIGNDSLKAVFTPTSSSDASSTGTALFVVQAIRTSTSLTVSPASPQRFGTAVTLTATVTAGVPGAVQFEVGSTDLGSPVAVRGGVATETTSSLPAGIDSLKAVFTPTRSSDAPSSGTALFVVQAIPSST